MTLPEYSALLGEYSLKPLSQLSIGMCSIVGVVTHAKPPKKTNGTDYILNLVLADPSIPANIDGLTVNIFRNTLAALPDVKPGTILYCTLKAISNISSQFAILDYGAEQGMANLVKYLKEWLGQRTIVTPRRSLGTARPLLTVEQIRPSVLCDLKAKILYIGNTGSQNKLTMILSDYTKNQLLTSDSTHRSQIDDQLPNHIPFDTAIRIFLWDENAEQAQGLKEGDVVHFKDLHPRLDSFGRLELFMHGDKGQTSGTRRSRIQLLLKTDLEVVEIKMREKQLLNEINFLVKNNNVRATGVPDNTFGTGSTILKEANTFSKINAASMAQGVEKRFATTLVPLTSSISALNLPNKYKLQAKSIDRLPFSLNVKQQVCLGCNLSYVTFKNCKCDGVIASSPIAVQGSLEMTQLNGAEHLPLTTISSVLSSTLPNKYRIRGKIIDVLPRTLNIKRKMCLGCKVNYTKDKKCSCSGAPQTNTIMLSLLLSDGSGFLPVIIAGPEALVFMGEDENLYSTKLEKIMKINDGILEGNEIECLVLGYQIDEGIDKVWRFKMFNTIIN